MISSDSPFREFLTELASQSQIALDTEADSLHCYFEKLCLVQIGWPGKLQLLDPLANLPLPDFFEALRGKRLIFHDADYDFRLLRRSGEFPTIIFLIRCWPLNYVVSHSLVWPP